MDEVSNIYGENMLDAMVGYERIVIKGIFNSRGRGQSVVDCFSNFTECAKPYRSYNWFPKYIESDHRPITFTLEVFWHFTNEKSKPSNTDVDYHGTIYRYVWYPEKQSKYH